MFYACLFEHLNFTFVMLSARRNDKSGRQSKHSQMHLDFSLP